MAAREYYKVPDHDELEEGQSPRVLAACADGLSRYRNTYNVLRAALEVALLVSMLALLASDRARVTSQASWSNLQSMPSCEQHVKTPYRHVTKLTGA